LIFAFSGTSAKPYVVVGGGLYNTKGDIPGAKSQNNLGFNAGLGATFGLGPVAAFLESRYHSISRKDIKGGVIQFVPITVGLLF
jgi:opacity protein-like surface antigen